MKFYSLSYLLALGARGGTVGWGTALQARRSRVRFPMVSLKFFIDIRVKEQRNILHEIRKRKANWIGDILRRNCLLQRITEGKIQGGIEVTGRQERRRRKLLDDLKERRGYSHLKEEALDRTVWRPRFGRGFRPVVRQITKWMNNPSGRTRTMGLTQPLTKMSTRNISWV